jgi:methyl-accepting chemotaxis protein
MQVRLTEVITEIREGADGVGLSSSQVENGNTELSQRTQEQASSLEEIASSMEEMTGTIRSNADSAHQANQLAKHARKEANEGKEIVDKAVNAMKILNDSSRRIAEIINVIDEIAFQTNLLALNASVEAARAGEQGRGFAVVAGEVRNLAGRCKTAAKDIKGLIDDSVEKVTDGTGLVNKSGDALEKIQQEVKKVSEIIEKIASASSEQSSGIAQVNRAILNLDDMTQSNASLVEEAAAASESLGAQAVSLRESVAYFKLHELEHTDSAPDEEEAITEINVNNEVAGTDVSMLSRQNATQWLQSSWDSGQGDDN